MRLHILTIALDAIPFLPAQLYTFNQLDIDWVWHIAEGVAAPVLDTGWCKPIGGRLSRDGTAEFLNTLARHPRIRLYRKNLWNGKTEMFNAMLQDVKTECVLMQIDADEMWSAENLKSVWHFGKETKWEAFQFHCRYFVGPNIIITSQNTYGNRSGEWVRAWHFKPGATFLSHEPPVLSPCGSLADTRLARPNMFNHYAYVYESQVLFKEKYYGYPNALDHWRKLQNNTLWPAKLRDFFPWVTDNATVDLLYK